MRFPSAALGLLLLIGATGCSAPPEAEPAAPDPAEAGPESSPDLELDEIQAALDAGRWEEALTAAESYLADPADPERQWKATAIAAVAAHGLSRWEECIEFVRFCRESTGGLDPDPKLGELLSWLAFPESRALLALGRIPEAEGRLEEAARRFPAIVEDSDWRWLRWIARPAEGVEFDPYEVGPFAQERVREGRRRLERAFPEALEHLRRRLGDPDLALPPVLVQVIDGSEDMDAWMSATAFPRGSGWRGVIRARVEVVVHPTMQDVRLLSHELTHVLDTSGGGRRERPGWVAEGLAHWVESDDERSHQEMVLDHAVSVDDSPVVPLSTVLASERSLADADEETQRVAGAVIFFHVERVQGLEAARRLVLRLLKEADHEAVLQEVTGLAMDDLLRRVRAEYLEWAEASFPGRPLVMTASRLAGEGKFPEALQTLEQYLGSPDPGPMRAWAELLRLNIRIESGNWEAARDALAPIRVLRGQHPLGPTVASGLVSEFRVLEASGDWAGIVAVAKAALDSLWVRHDSDRAEVEKRLLEATKRLETAPGPR
jgi:hypothetical protein